MILIILSIILLSLIVILYLSLGLKAPLGFLAWGGQHKGVLPKNLRMQSLLSIPALLFAIIVIIYTSEIIPNDGNIIITVFAYVFMVYFFLNTILNLLSKSIYEKAIMAPITVILFINFIYILFIR